jgi:hypothetical protein
MSRLVVGWNLAGRDCTPRANMQRLTLNPGFALCTTTLLRKQDEQQAPTRKFGVFALCTAKGGAMGGNFANKSLYPLTLVDNGCWQQKKTNGH